MDSEENTFRILSRPCYKEMRDIWASSELFERRCSIGSKLTNSELDQFFELYKWSVEEYTTYNNKDDNY